MTYLKTFCLLIALVLFSNIQANPVELDFELEKHQKLIGTYSGDIDQEVSIHLVIFKDKKANDYKIRPFFNDQNGEMTRFADVAVSEEPSIFSFHYDFEKSNLTLILSHGRKASRLLEVIDLNTVSKEIGRKTINEERNPLLRIRTKDRTFLIYKENDGLFKKTNEIDIRTLYTSKKEIVQTFSFEGKNEELFQKIFEVTPESINTNEWLEHGSIRSSKVYFYNDRLIFDHISIKGYTTLTLDPEDSTQITFEEYELGDSNKIRGFNSFIYDSKIFIFLNDKNDISLRHYDLESGELLKEISLLEKLSGVISPEDLKKVIQKSSRERFSLTGTINEGANGSMIISIGYVENANYFYNYDWWWNHHFFNQQMIWNNQMIQQQIQIQSQIRNFGPNPQFYLPLEIIKNEAPTIQFITDSELNILEAQEIEPVRPKIDKEKYIKRFEHYKQFKDVSMAFTKYSGWAVYYSTVTNKLHLLDLKL